MNSSDLIKLYDEFRQKWPIDRIKSMTLDEYTKVGDKDTFCYWMESRLESWGAIWGGSAYKFGIFNTAKQPANIVHRLYNDNYAWYEKYGKTQEEAFVKVRAIIYDIACAAQSGDLDRISKADLGHAFKWKIAFHYQQDLNNPTVLPIFKKEMLQKLCPGMSSSTSTATYYKTLIDKKSDSQDLATYYTEKLLPGLDSAGKVIDKATGASIRDDAQVWLWAPGANGSLWDAFYKKGCMGLGWDYLEDFTQYDEDSEIAAAIRQNEPDAYSNKSPNQCVNMIRCFTSSIQPGDIVIVKKGLYKLIGWGVVMSDYYYDSEASQFRSRRKVQWFDNKEHSAGVRSNGEQRQLPQKALTEIGQYPDMTKDLFQIMGIDAKINPKCSNQSYIDLLRANRNLILTGAPGTGKTWLARSIAKEMGAEVAFVQFHPSYDYSDFVEGLRPKKDDSGNLGFERQDGVFKEFCKKAQKNIEDSAKSQESLAKEVSILEKLETFLSEAVDNQTKFETVTGTSFTIESFDDTRVVILNDAEKANRLNVNLTEIQDLLTNNVQLTKVGDIKIYFDRKYRLQMDSYQYVICTEVRKMKSTALVPVSDVQVVQKKDYVFIIDEINRGELSKIFGELFFSIDPGYRGKSDMPVKTQYQNLVESSDVFGKGFFVPSNVYILGTMNDIDRSVESMDYAMRRRFAWKEVLPEDRIEMWEEAFWADEATVRMENLNKAISGIHGLGKAYQVGPAYFLKLNEYDGDFSKLWDLHISVLLQEYLRGFADADELYAALQSAYNTTSFLSVEE